MGAHVHVCVYTFFLFFFYYYSSSEIIYDSLFAIKFNWLLIFLLEWLYVWVCVYVFVSFFFLLYHSSSLNYLAQSARAIKYTDCISAEGQDSSYECPVYDT